MGTTLEQVLERIEPTLRSIVEEAVAPLKESQTGYAAKLAEMMEKRGARGMEADEEPGLIIGRTVRALAMAKGHPELALTNARKVWGADDPVVKALEAGDLTAGGFLIGPNFVAEVIPLLTEMAAVRGLGPTSVPLTNGTATIPKVTGGATASYVGESANIVASQQTFGDLNLSAKKLVALVPVSNDWLRRASVSADRVVRDDLLTQMALREDLAFIRGDGLSNTPKGLRNWALAANVEASNGTDTTPTLGEITDDLDGAWLKLRSANVPMTRPGWLMSPRVEKVLRGARDGNGNYVYRAEMLAGRLDGKPFKSTTQIPENLGAGSDETELYYVDFAQAIVADEESIMIDASNTAAYHDGANVQASFSKDQTVIRAISTHDFGMRYDAAVHVRNVIKWTTAPS